MIIPGDIFKINKTKIFNSQINTYFMINLFFNKKNVFSGEKKNKWR